MEQHAYSPTNAGVRTHVCYNWPYKGVTQLTNCSDKYRILRAQCMRTGSAMHSRQSSRWSENLQSCRNYANLLEPVRSQLRDMNKSIVTNHFFHSRLGPTCLNYGKICTRQAGRVRGQPNSPVFFPTRIGERASANHAHWKVVSLEGYCYLVRWFEATSTHLHSVLTKIVSMLAHIIRRCTSLKPTVA